MHYSIRTWKVTKNKKFEYFKPKNLNLTKWSLCTSASVNTDFLWFSSVPTKKYTCYLSKHFEQTHRVQRLIYYLVCISLSYSFFFITSFYTSFSFPILSITLLFYSSPYLYHVLVFLHLALTLSWCVWVWWPPPVTWWPSFWALPPGWTPGSTSYTCPACRP